MIKTPQTNPVNKAPPCYMAVQKYENVGSTTDETEDNSASHQAPRERGREVSMDCVLLNRFCYKKLNTEYREYGLIRNIYVHEIGKERYYFECSSAASGSDCGCGEIRNVFTCCP